MHINNFIEKNDISDVEPVNNGTTIIIERESNPDPKTYFNDYAWANGNERFENDTVHVVSPSTVHLRKPLTITEDKSEKTAVDNAKENGE